MCDPEGSLDAACTTKPQALTIVDATVNTAQRAFTPVINPYLLKASLTFSPASFRFDFTCSPLPSFWVRLSPVTLPTASLALPRTCWPLFFALSVPLTVSAPTSRRSTRVAERPGPGYLASQSSKLPPRPNDGPRPHRTTPAARRRLSLASGRGAWLKGQTDGPGGEGTRCAPTAVGRSRNRRGPRSTRSTPLTRLAVGSASRI